MSGSHFVDLSPHPQTQVDPVMLSRLLPTRMTGTRVALIPMCLTSFGQWMTAE